MAELCETGTSVKLARGYLHPDDESAVQWCWDQVKPSLEDSKKMNGSILVEQRVDLSSVGLNVEGDPERCRIDLAIIVGEVAYLFDWKFGEGYVPRPKYNWQFRMYALGLVLDYGVKRVIATKLQPAAAEAFRRTADEFSDTDLMALADRVREISKACASPDAPLVTGENQC